MKAGSVLRLSSDHHMIQEYEMNSRDGCAKYMNDNPPPKSPATQVPEIERSEHPPEGRP